MAKTSFLNPGDTIGVAAPSSRFNKDEFQRGVHCLEDLGFDVRVPDLIFEKRRYLSGDDDLRADVINELFADPDVKGIIAARGGYGAMRILDRIDWDAVMEQPKPFIGYSDVTALLISMVQRAGIESIHGPNLVSLPHAPESTLSGFVRALSGAPLDITAEQGECLIPGKAIGMLTGGNLATLSHMIGTPFQPDFSESILFIEDVGEPAYKIDRFLVQMKMAGMFDAVCGVVTGVFEKCENDDYIPEILMEIFEPFDIPVLMGIESGHGETNLSLILGRAVELNASHKTIQWK